MKYIYIYIYIYIQYIYIYSLEQRTKMKGPGCLDCYYSKSFCFPWSKVPKCSASLKRAAFFSLGLGSQTTTPQMDGCVRGLSHLLTSVFYLDIVYILKHHLPSRPRVFWIMSPVLSSVSFNETVRWETKEAIRRCLTTLCRANTQVHREQLACTWDFGAFKDNISK